MAGDGDQSCFENPELVTNSIITCKSEMKYCVTIRQELLDPKDEPVSIARTCQETALNNEVTEDATYRYYFTSCKDDLCNGGSGKDTSGNNGAQGDTGGVGTLLVPGIGNNGTNMITFSRALIILCGLLSFMNILK